MDIDIQDNKCVEMDEGEEIDYEPSGPETTNLFDDMQPDDIAMEDDPDYYKHNKHIKQCAPQAHQTRPTSRNTISPASDPRLCTAQQPRRGGHLQALGHAGGQQGPARAE